MRFFIDTADTDEIRDLAATGPSWWGTGVSIFRGWADAVPPK